MDNLTCYEAFRAAHDLLLQAANRAASLPDSNGERHEQYAKVRARLRAALRLQFTDEELTKAYFQFINTYHQKL